MSSTAPVAGGGALADQSGRKPGKIWLVHGLFTLLLAGYLISLAVRSADAYSTVLDGWSVDAWELALCAMVFYRAFTRRPGRALSLALGGAMLMWSLGDVALTIESLGGASPPTPSVADGFYLAFYPLAYLGLVLLLRRESSKLVPATWLDGAVAGLGAAALCAAFAFDRIMHLSGGGGVAATATNLAYPVGDVLLLAMAVGGSAVLAGSGRRAWRLVAAGCAVVAIGDTSNLFQATSSTHLGAIADGIAWPSAILLLSAAVWAGRGRTNLLAHQPAPGFLLPGLGAAAGLGILLAGSISHVNSVAIGLAAATLAVVGIRLTLSVASLRKLTEERHRQAITDHLTSLGNRRRLASVLDSFFADHADQTTDARRLAFLFVDLDQFKEVNDSFGHPAGDQLLAQIGPRFKRCLGPDDLLVRIGGDELAVVLQDADDAHAAAVATSLAETLEDPFELDMVSVQIGASIGVAFAPDDATDPDELMRCADKAMYRCKQAGTAYETYDERIDAERDRLRMMDDLRTAIAENQFELHYQPVVNVRNGTTSAVEALLRWPHPRLGYIPPLEFLPLAEEGGLMRPLTTLVMDRALTQCARWRAEGQNLAVAINVSATNILDADFVDIVRQQLHHHQLPPNALVVEITETTLISDFERCKRVTGELTDLGCMVSIDDFGAGFTSLAYLSRLAVGELKLDRTFLSGLTGEDGMRDLDLVRATIQLAHALGLVVVAEGVEERSTLDLLQAIGCDLAQGYHIGRPAPAAALSFRTDLAA